MSQYFSPSSASDNADRQIIEEFKVNMLHKTMDVMRFGAVLINSNPSEATLLYMAKINVILRMSDLPEQL